MVHEKTSDLSNHPSTGGESRSRVSAVSAVSEGRTPRRRDSPLSVSRGRARATVHGTFDLAVLFRNVCGRLSDEH